MTTRAKRQGATFEVGPNFARVEEDGDEVSTPMPTKRLRFSCAQAPLVTRGRFRVCPRCSASYGGRVAGEQLTMATDYVEHGCIGGGGCPGCDDTARLVAERDAYRAALESIVNCDRREIVTMGPHGMLRLVAIARNALTNGKGC